MPFRIGREGNSEAAVQRQEKMGPNIRICTISTWAPLRLLSPGPLGRIVLSVRASEQLIHQTEPRRSRLRAPRGEERRAAIAQPPTHPKRTPARAATPPGKGKMGSCCLYIKKRVITHNKKTRALVYINTALTECPSQTALLAHSSSNQAS